MPLANKHEFKLIKYILDLFSGWRPSLNRNPDIRLFVTQWKIIHEEDILET